MTAKISTNHFLADFKPGATYEIIKVRSGGREVEMSVSPTGKSVRVFVDGAEIKQTKEKS